MVELVSVFISAFILGVVMIDYGNRRLLIATLREQTEELSNTLKKVGEVHSNQSLELARMGARIESIELKNANMAILKPPFGGR